MLENEIHAPTLPAPPSARRRFMPIGVAALLMFVCVGAAYFALRDTLTVRVAGNDEECEQPSGEQPQDGYRKWDKPLLALILSGQMHGYVDPCGCSEPQHGGLVRRYNFIQSLLTGAGTKNDEKWDIVGIDMGELPQLQGIHKQNLLKYELSMKALSAMRYRVIGIGKHEILSPLEEALAQVWDKHNPYPRPINLSLAKAVPGQLLNVDLNVRQYEILNDVTPKIGIINLVGPDLRNELKDNAKFLNNLQELPKVLKAFADAGVEVGIILHHEYPDVGNVPFPGKAIDKARRDQARKCAQFCADEREKNKKIPPIQLMMVLTEDSEPSEVLQRLDPKLPTYVIEIGHKGKYVGLVGVYRENKEYGLKYKMVEMDPSWETKKEDKGKHPVIALMERYNQELKSQDMLGQHPRSPHFNQIPAPPQTGLRATYVGSKRCGQCHADAYKVWKDSANFDERKRSHFVATNTLEELKHPSGRQYDPECMKCHTTGLNHPGGYNDPIDGDNLAKWAPPKPGQKADAKILEKHNLRLRGVGCESCHGPGSEHADNPKNKALHKLMNQFAPTAEERKLEEIAKKTPVQQKTYDRLFENRMGALSRFCITCHDGENDVNWGKNAKGDHISAADFMRSKWIGKKLIHRTPKEDEPEAAPPPENDKKGPAVIEERPPVVIDVIEQKKK